MRVRLLPLISAAAALVACAAPLREGRAVSPPPPAAGAPVPERWVDASAPPGGDGSREHPLRDLRALAVQPGPRRIHLRTGLYAGPFQVGPGTSLEGDGEVVLHADGDVPAVVTLHPGASLRGLTVQGGEVGVALGGGVAQLESVELSGQRRAGLQLSARAHAVLRNVTLSATVSGTEGISAKGEGATVDVAGSRFEGPFQAGLSLAEHAAATVRDCRFRDAVTAVKALDAQLLLERVEISGGRGPAIGLNGVTATLRQLTVFGQEYGLLGGPRSEIELLDFTSIRPDRAGIGLYQAKVRARGVLVTDTGSYGGVQSVDSELELERFLLLRTQAWGIAVMGGRATLRDGTIREVSSTAQNAGSGDDGIVVRRGTARVEAVRIDDVRGAGIEAAEGSELTVRAVELDRTGWGGLLVESFAHVDARSVISRHSSSAAVVVPDRARLRVDALSSEDDADGPLYAECGQGAEVVAGRIRSRSKQGLTSRCVAAWTVER